MTGKVKPKGRGPRRLGYIEDELGRRANYRQPFQLPTRPNGNADEPSAEFTPATEDQARMIAAEAAIWSKAPTIAEANQAINALHSGAPFPPVRQWRTYALIEAIARNDFGEGAAIWRGLTPQQAADFVIMVTRLGLWVGIEAMK